MVFNDSLINYATFATLKWRSQIRADSYSAIALNVKKNILCFYVWLVGDVLWCIFDLAYKMYGCSALDFVQVILYIWGIISWKKVSQKEQRVE